MLSRAVAGVGVHAFSRRRGACRALKACGPWDACVVRESARDGAWRSATLISYQRKQNHERIEASEAAGAGCVGRTLELWWDGDKQWFAATVVGFDEV